MIRSLSVLSAGVVALAVAGAANADNDLIRLDGKGDADLLETRAYGGGFRGGVGFGGYRGGIGYGGYRGGIGYGGYRGIGYGGYGRGYGYGGFGRSYYGGFYGRPYYGYNRGYYGYGLGIGLGFGYGGNYGGYYGSYYSPGYYSSYSLGPCATDATYMPATTLNFVQPALPQTPGDGTFPYDGGPRDGSLVPLPAGIPSRSNLPRDGSLVSVPAPTSGYQFLAFGEQPVAPVRAPNVSDTVSVSYPAFGETPVGFSGGTTLYPAVLR